MRKRGNTRLWKRLNRRYANWTKVMLRLLYFTPTLTLQNKNSQFRIRLLFLNTLVGFWFATGYHASRLARSGMSKQSSKPNCFLRWNIKTEFNWMNISDLQEENISSDPIDRRYFSKKWIWPNNKKKTCIISKFQQQ